MAGIGRQTDIQTEIRTEKDRGTGRERERENRTEKDRDGKRQREGQRGYIYEG